MSRKLLVGILGVIGALAAYFTQAFGLSVDGGVVFAGLTAVLVYVLYEWKKDRDRIGLQAGKFKDPKFWIAIISVLLGALKESLGLNIPADTIILILTFVMGILFKTSK